MSSISDTSGNVGIEPDHAVENIAKACSLIDDMIVKARLDADMMNVAWSGLRRELADRVVVLAREGYICSDSVTEALGAEFADGPLLEAAIRLGWLERPERGDAGQLAETEIGTGSLDAIRHCLGGQE